MTGFDLVKSTTLSERKNEHIRKFGVKNEINTQSQETHRTEFRRQRDRILYTGGFRRLQDKTQVIAATKTGDHRTRLTHSLEVEQIATSLAEALGLNADLCSAIAVGHDVGHTPFGHAVERFLNTALKDEGGFAHSVQSVRYLKNKKINLSYEVFEGILKHDTDIFVGSYNKEHYDCDELNPYHPGSLEAQAVYWADKLAYLSHDFEDFYETEIFRHALEADSGLKSRLQRILSNLVYEKKTEIAEDISNFETRDLIRNLLSKLMENSIKVINSIEDLNVSNVREKTKIRIEENIKNELKVQPQEMTEKKMKKLCYQRGLLINFDEEYSVYYEELRNILDEKYIRSPEVQRSDAKAIKIVTSLFNEFKDNVRLLPWDIQSQMTESNHTRVIADYIASMTDRYAEEIYSNLNSIGSKYDY